MAASLNLPRSLHAAGAAVAALGLLVRLAWGGPLQPRGPALLVDLSALVSPAALLGSLLLLLVALGVFVRRASPTAALCAGLLLALWALLLDLQWPAGSGVDNGSTLPAATLLAWGIAGLLVQPGSVAHAGREAACGVVAAAYLLAVGSKLLGSGLGWASGQNLALHIAVHDGGGVLSALRWWVIGQPAVCGLLGVGTLCIEGAAVLFLWRRARRPWSLLAAALHLGIALLMGLHHYDWLLVVLGLAGWGEEDEPGLRLPLAAVEVETGAAAPPT